MENSSRQMQIAIAKSEYLFSSKWSRKEKKNPQKKKNTQAHESKMLYYQKEHIPS